MCKFPSQEKYSGITVIQITVLYILHHHMHSNLFLFRVFIPSLIMNLQLILCSLRRNNRGWSSDTTLSGREETLGRFKVHRKRSHSWQRHIVFFLLNTVDKNWSNESDSLNQELIGKDAWMCMQGQRSLVIKSSAVRMFHIIIPHFKYFKNTIRHHSYDITSVNLVLYHFFSQFQLIITQKKNVF